MAETLAKVKREFGKDAVILNTRTQARNGVLGIRGKPYVEITAAKQMSDLPESLRRSTLKVRPAREKFADGAADIVSPPNNQSVSIPPTVLSSEISELKAMVSELVRETRKTRSSPVPDDLIETYQHLIENAVADELATEMVHQIDNHLTDEQRRDPEVIHSRLTSLMGSMIPESTPIQLAKTSGPTIIALVGPTGVGKTTTIAKLAANFCLRENKKVGLITLDTYRIAAVEQLKTYAQIIEIPIEVAMSLHQLQEAIARMADRDIILIDTAGRSQRDGDKIKELQKYFQEVKPHEIHLVLSSTCGEKVLCQTIDRFNVLGFDRVIFTKLDEAIGFGVILTCLQKAKVQLSYLTTGQDVPDDIEVGQSQRVAELILKGSRINTIKSVSK